MQESRDICYSMMISVNDFYTNRKSDQTCIPSMPGMGMKGRSPNSN